MGRGGQTGGQGSGVSRKPPVKKGSVSAARPATKPPSKRPTFTTTDTGNTERMHHHYGRDLRYVTSWGSYITWTGSVWKKDVGGGSMLRLSKATTQTIKDDAKALLKSTDKKEQDRGKALWAWWKTSEAMARREAMIRGIRGERNVEIEHTALDADPWLLGVSDGVVDLHTGKRLPNDRKYMLTKRTPVPYKPGAKASRWMQFLKEVLPDPEIRDFIQRFVGYCLTGLVTERTFLILYGGGRNGKSIFLQVLQKLLGPYAISTAPGLLMNKGETHPTEVADLFGARLAVASEVKKGRVFDEEQVKRLTGNDVLKARKMREDFWEFEPTFKLMLAANHKPQVRDDSASFWDRLALIPFEVRIDEKKEDKRLLEKLIAELPGIMAWAVEGCLRWQKQGLKRPEAVMKATEDYRRNEDTLGKFFEEEVRFGINYETSSVMLTTRVKQWCEANNLIYTFKEKDMAEKLAAAGCTRTVIGPKVARVRGWKGLGLVKHHNGKTLEPLEAVPDDKPDPTKPERPAPNKPKPTTSRPVPTKPTGKTTAPSPTPPPPPRPPISLMDRIRKSKGPPRQDSTARNLATGDEDEEYTT